MSRSLTLAALLVLPAALGACADTERVALNECGNHILESGEDCDGTQGCSDACRIVCGVEQACPSGWGCDVAASICRAPSGIFTQQPLPIEPASLQLVADFDGDHRDDLLSIRSNTGLTSVSFFDATGALERSVTLPQAGAATVGKVTPDELPDVLLGSTSAVAFRASKDRTFSPIIGALRPMTPAAKLLSADLDCNGLRDFLVLGGDDKQSDNTLSLVSASGALTPLGELEITAAELQELEYSDPFFGVDGDLPGAAARLALERGELSAVGSFRNSAGSTCELLALPAPVQAGIDIYAAPDANGIKRLARVSYDSQLPMRRWFFVDVNEDGKQDLVLSNHDEQLLSYGVGDGTFHSRADSLPAPFTVGGDARAQLIESLSSWEVLAVGQLDGQPGLDYFGQYFAEDAAQFYTGARSLDLTGDGLLDIVAVAESRRADVFRGHPSGLVSRLSLRLNGLPRIEGVGDFDGDGLDDLLLAEASASDQPLRTASILFAPVTSDAATPVELATFESIEQLAAGYLPSMVGPGDSSMDIGVLFSTGEQLQLAFLAGGADRLLRSTLPTLATAEEDGFFIADEYVPVLGDFHEANTPELAMLKKSGHFFSDVDPEGDATTPAWVERLSIDASGIAVVNSSTTDGPPLAYQAPGVAVDLNDDGRDELYTLAESSLVQISAEGAGFTRETGLEASLEFGSLQAQDVNGDGLKDLSLVAGSDLLVLVASAAEVDRSPHRFALDAKLCAFDSYVFLQADTDPEPELVVNCAAFTYGQDAIDSRLLVLDVDLARDVLMLQHSQEGVGSSGFVKGDFNGDGVDDIACGANFYGLSPVLLLGVPR